MKQSKQYSTAIDFRRALEERLAQISKKENIDIQRLRRQVAFDRLLARLFAASPAPWVLKGGYAMQLRMSTARATKDVDLAVREGKLFSKNKEEQNKAILDLLREKADSIFPDFFSFLISDPILDLDAAPYGGARFHVEARLADRPFEKFHLDIGVGDVWIEPLDTLGSRGWLEFAGIEALSFPAIPKEQQFAEKLHAYTLPRKEGVTNSRTKDLVDMVLLIEAKELDAQKIATAIHATFERRATHKLDTNLPPPPASWIAPFKKMAEECGLKSDLAAAYKTVFEFVKTLAT